MSDDSEMLRIQNCALEKENRALRQTLLDAYAMAALTGLLAKHGANLEAPVASGYAFEHADAMLAARKEFA